MMGRRYLLDTNICVFCLRGKYDMLRKLQIAGLSNCFLSDITVAELYYGAENSQMPRLAMAQTEEFVRLFKVLPFSSSLHAYGREMAYLTRQGRKIENFDMAIGAIALQHGLVMVTDNVVHFERIRGLEIEDWKLVEPTAGY